MFQQYVSSALVFWFVDTFLLQSLFPQGHSNVKLQLAATFCISNLIWNEEDGKRLTTCSAAEHRIERRGVFFQTKQSALPDVCLQINMR